MMTLFDNTDSVKLRSTIFSIDHHPLMFREEDNWQVVGVSSEVAQSFNELRRHHSHMSEDEIYDLINIIVSELIVHKKYYIDKVFDRLMRSCNRRAIEPTDDFQDRLEKVIEDSMISHAVIVPFINTQIDTAINNALNDNGMFTLPHSEVKPYLSISQHFHPGFTWLLLSDKIQ